MSKNVLYRILFGDICNEDIKSLKEKIWNPKIPSCSLIDGENDNIERLCFSNSINSCLTAYGADRFLNLLEDSKSDTVPIVVLEVDLNRIDKNKVMTPDQLYDKKYVMDSIENQEYWILDKIKADRVHKGVIGEYYVDDSYVYPVPYKIREKFKTYEEAKESDVMEDYICNPTSLTITQIYNYQKIIGSDIKIIESL